MKNKLSRAARIEQNWGWFMVAPTIIGLIVLNVWPFIQTIYASFCEHLGFGHYKFIGIGNYVKMLQSAEFWKATGNTLLFCVLTVPVGIFLSLLVAVMLNAKVKFKGGFRTIFFLPMVCAPRRGDHGLAVDLQRRLRHPQPDLRRQRQVDHRPQGGPDLLRHCGHLERHRL